MFSYAKLLLCLMYIFLSGCISLPNSYNYISDDKVSIDDLKVKPKIAVAIPYSVKTSHESRRLVGSNTHYNTYEDTYKYYISKSDENYRGYGGYASEGHDTNELESLYNILRSELAERRLDYSNVNYATNYTMMDLIIGFNYGGGKRYKISNSDDIIKTNILYVLPDGFDYYLKLSESQEYNNSLGLELLSILTLKIIPIIQSQTKEYNYLEVMDKNKKTIKKYTNTVYIKRNLEWLPLLPLFNMLNDNYTVFGVRPYSYRPELPMDKRELIVKDLVNSFISDLVKGNISPHGSK